jgi:hypothetical protein
VSQAPEDCERLVLILDDVVANHDVERRRLKQIREAAAVAKVKRSAAAEFAAICLFSGDRQHRVRSIQQIHRESEFCQTKGKRPGAAANVECPYGGGSRQKLAQVHPSQIETQLALGGLEIGDVPVSGLKACCIELRHSDELPAESA